MVYREILPPPALSHIVRYFWIIESEELSAEPLKYRLFAESSPGLVFFYHYDYALISGITDSHREFMMEGKLGMMGAFLYPYAMQRLFNVSSEELTNRTIEISDFLGNEGLILKNDIVNAGGNDKRVEILSQFLFGKMKYTIDRDDGVCAGVQQIVRHKGGLSIDTLINDIGISGRQFDRRFIKGVGIPPKVFSRLIRFHSTLQLPRQMAVKNLTELALYAGYYDQSHFIREFKTFSGLSPKDYFKLGKDQIADNFVRMTD
jgi:AraC-like DNA-binding protein